MASYSLHEKPVKGFLNDRCSISIGVPCAMGCFAYIPFVKISLSCCVSGSIDVLSIGLSRMFFTKWASSTIFAKLSTSSDAHTSGPNIYLLNVRCASMMVAPSAIAAIGVHVLAEWSEKPILDLGYFAFR